MEKNLSDHYDEGCYSNHREGMCRSAETVLGLLYDFYKPRSIIDVGCGQGAWLASAESFGATALKGLDGDWIKEEGLLSKNIDFLPVNFDSVMPTLNIKYDLCISLEVAEHLSEENAKHFVEFLCNVSDVVLFSAAIKDQGGENHINEQWQSYWIDLFESNGYKCFDLFRPKLWNNASVDWWYRQNIFLFVDLNNSSLHEKALRGLEKPIFDIVHPVVYERMNKILRE